MKKLIKDNYLNIVVFLILTVIFTGLLFFAQRGEKQDLSGYKSYTLYERAVVSEVVSDESEPEEMYEGHYVGNQYLYLTITSGQYKGLTLTGTNYLSALIGTKLEDGDHCVVALYMENGEVRSVSIYDYSRVIPIIILITVFFLVTVAVGGKRGAHSLVGLIFTVVSLFFILLPLLLKGFPTIPTTLMICIFVAMFSFLLLGGINKKTVTAMIGTAFGLIMSMLFGLISQKIFRVDGMRMGEYIDSLLQLKFSGSTLKLKGLLIGGTLISALGAVMDVAMSISSSMSELTALNPNLTRKKIFSSGMNIGHDIIGTMTNTLILAFVGSSLVMLLYICSQDYPAVQLFSSNLIAVELVHSISSSIGVILSVPLTVFVSSLIYKSDKK